MDMTEHADQSVNTTTMVKEYTNPLKAPIDNDINLFDFLDQRASRDPEGSMVEYKGEAYATNDDSAEKRAVGEKWAQLSEGKCLFIMAVKKDAHLHPGASA